MSANFVTLDSAEKLDALFEQSNKKPVILFKHSTTCPISASVYGEVAKVDDDVNIVVVQSSRNIAEAIAERTGVRHESPQAIVIKSGEAVYQASHFDVTAEELRLASENV